MVSHKNIDNFVDASGFIWHSVDVVHGDWFGKLAGWKFGCSNKVPVAPVFTMVLRFLYLIPCLVIASLDVYVFGLYYVFGLLADYAISHHH